LFWQVVLALERSAAALLRWSNWRRWHQAWAGYWHNRRRGNGEQASNDKQSAASTTDSTDVVWQRLEPLLPDAHRVGRPYEYDRRLVLEAIVYVMQSGCGWRALPSSFPPWQTVYEQLRQWRKSGIWDTIWSGLDQPHLTDELQL
jgi:transposase